MLIANNNHYVEPVRKVISFEYRGRIFETDDFGDIAYLAIKSGVGVVDGKDVDLVNSIFIKYRFTEISPRLRCFLESTTYTGANLPDWTLQEIVQGYLEVVRDN